MAEGINFAVLLNLAQYYLAKRDHSVNELRNKLNKYCLLKNKPTTFKAYSSKSHYDEVVDIEICDYDFSSQNHQLTKEQVVTIDEVILYCQTHNWLDDARFTERYITSQHKKGCGKNKLKQSLYQKGIAKEVINRFLDNAEIDWFELAYNTAMKKFKSLDQNLPSAEKAKIVRFLQARGFSFDEINAIFD